KSTLIEEASAVLSVYSAVAVILTLPRSMSLALSLRRVSSLYVTALGTRMLNSKNLEFRDLISTVYLTFAFSCAPIPYPVMDFIIRKGIKRKSFFILPHGMIHRYSSLKKDIRESEAFFNCNKPYYN